MPPDGNPIQLMIYLWQIMEPKCDQAPIKPQWVQGTGEHSKGHHRDVISKIETGENSTGQTISFLQKLRCRREEDGGGTYRLKEI